MLSPLSFLTNQSVNQSLFFMRP